MIPHRTNTVIFTGTCNLDFYPCYLKLDLLMPKFKLLFTGLLSHYEMV